MQVSGAPLLHVPYKGISPAMNDTIAGHVSLIFLLGPDAVPHAKSGRLIPLAVAAPKRTQLLPNTPTFAEAGFAAVELSAWYGFLAPAKTPPAVLVKLNTAVATVLADGELNERLKGLLFEPQSSSPKELAHVMARDLERFTAVARRAGIKLD
jgi:tripartite-type tricarboxylate transporter receptor subunit TctC